MYEALKKGDAKISVVGLGYVGLPLALEFARCFSVIGFDINSARVDMMRLGVDPSKELDTSAFKGTNIHFTCEPSDLDKASFHVIAVPTDIDDHKTPNLVPLQKASERYMRNHMDLNVLEESKRFPRGE